MKITKAQKEKNRLALIEAAIRVSRQAGFKAASMKEISLEAGLSEAAIYNYFATKDELITGYFGVRSQQAIQTAGASMEYSKLSLPHKVQWLIESHLEIISAEEFFLQEAFHQLFVQPISIAQSGISAFKKSYVAFIEREMQSAIARGDFREPPFLSFLCELVWDFHLGVIYYWLKDQSRLKANTSQVIQMGTALFGELLTSEVLGKTYHLAHFLFKEHILSKIFKVGSEHGQ